MRYWYGDQRRYAYRQTWDLHLGAEYLLDALVPAGLRLRAGLAWEPVPYRILLEGMVPVGDDVEPVYYPAHFDPDRLTYTVGAGLLVQESLTVDAAYAIGSFHREGRDLSEDHTEQRFVLTAGFRLD